jgi:hypothetical protein
MPLAGHRDRCFIDLEGSPMQASGQPRKTPPPASPDPLIGSTLALLSTYARTQQLGAAQKIARNLALLAQHPGVSAPLQSVCNRLFEDWLGAAEHDEDPLDPCIAVHEEPPLMQ